jgi:hypothetical protein
MTQIKLEVAGYDATAPRSTNFEGKHIIRLVLSRPFTLSEMVQVTRGDFNRTKDDTVEVLVDDLDDLAAAAAAANATLARIEADAVAADAAADVRAEKERREAEERDAKLSEALGKSGLKPINRQQ